MLSIKRTAHKPNKNVYTLLIVAILWMQHYDALYDGMPASGLMHSLSIRKYCKMVIKADKPTYSVATTSRLLEVMRHLLILSSLILDAASITVAFNIEEKPEERGLAFLRSNRGNEFCNK